AIVSAYLEALAHRPKSIPAGRFPHDWCAAWNARQRTAGPPAPRPIKRTTLLRWVKRYRTRGLAGLIDGRVHHGEPAWSAEAMDFMVGMYCDENRPQLSIIYERAAAIAIAEGWEMPSLRTVQSHIQKKVDPKLLALGRDPKRFRDRCLPHVNRDWTKVPAMGCWVGDHRQLDLLLPREIYVAARKRNEWRWYRPWLTMFLDARSWMPVAWSMRFDAPDGNQVMSTFAAGVERHGKPETVYLDNGKDFRMYRFAGGRTRAPRKGERIVAERIVQPMLELLGVEVVWSLPYNAQAKIVEPWFRLMSERFDKTWATYCGNRTENRPERLKKINGRAADFAAMGYTIEAVSRAFDEWITGDYGLRESPSTAAKPLSAARAFQDLRRPDFVAVRPPAEDLAILLMPSKAVVVEANGIWCKPHGRYYWSDQLEDRRGCSGRDARRKVSYRWRDDDPSRIFVFDGRADKFLCTATPYIGEGIDPLADPETDEARRLAAQLALRRGIEKRARGRLRDLTNQARNLLLESQRRGAEALGLHDARMVDGDKSLPGPRVIRLTEMSPAGAALAEDRRACEAAERDRPAAGATAADLLAAAPDAPGAREPTERPSALEILASSQDQDDTNAAPTPTPTPRDSNPWDVPRPPQCDKESHNEPTGAPDA
ncbi:MAG: Mu transposase C-terminal domain-containing protein, partial [Planctomycetota bacterium]